MKFYEKLSEKQIEILDEFYKQKPQLYKRHEKDFNNYVSETNEEMFYLANKLLNEESNKHLEFIKKNKKYEYDSQFSYLEKRNDLIILKYFYNSYLERIAIFDKDNYYGFMYKNFKTTDVALMIDSSNSTTMGYYADGWSLIYIHNQRLRDQESIDIIKSLERFKYIPFEKFEKLNYFILLTASKEQLYNWELLLKFGATKCATQLMLRREIMTKELFTKYKDYLKKNRSLDYILEKEAEEKKQFEKISNRKKYKILKEALKKQKKILLEFKDYILTNPTCWEDFEKESEELHHCLASNNMMYAEKVILKKSNIYFLRKKDNPEKPFFTIEASNNKIVQCRTKNNETDPEITKIVEKMLMQI